MTAPGGFSPNDVLTAADMNALPGGIVGGSGVGWDTITANQAINTSLLTVLTCTFTAQAGRLYQIDLSAYFYNPSTAMYCSARIYEGATLLNQVDKSLDTSFPFNPISLTVIRNPTAGSKTITAQFRTSTGTAGIAAGATYGPWLIIKDVGPA